MIPLPAEETAAGTTAPPSSSELVSPYPQTSRPNKLVCQEALRLQQRKAGQDICSSCSAWNGQNRGVQTTGWERVVCQQQMRSCSDSFPPLVVHRVPVAALLSILFVVSLRLFILLCFEIGSYVAHTDLQLTGWGWPRTPDFPPPLPSAGVIVVPPVLGSSYPFPQRSQQHCLVLGGLRHFSLLSLGTSVLSFGGGVW